MATRFYFNLTTAADVTPPTPLADWEHQETITTRKMELIADNSTLTSTAVNPDGAADLTDKDVLHRQYVSVPIAAQTFTGNVTAQIQVSEDNTRNNLFIAVAIRVISNDGTTVQNESLGVTRSTTTEAGTSPTNMTFPATSIGSYATASGDRILVELGLGGNAGAASGEHNGTMTWGTNASGGDLPVDETETGTTFRGWIEFSNTLQFVVPKLSGNNFSLLEQRRRRR